MFIDLGFRARKTTTVLSLFVFATRNITVTAGIKRIFGPGRVHTRTTVVGLAVYRRQLLLLLQMYAFKCFTRQRRECCDPNVSSVKTSVRRVFRAR